MDFEKIRDESSSNGSEIAECRVHSAQNLHAELPVQCSLMTQMRYISLMIRVGYASQPNLHLQCMDGYSDDGTPGVDTSFRVSGSRVPSWTLSSRIPILCGTFRQLPKDMITSARSWSAHCGEILRSSLRRGSLICNLAFGVDCVSK